MIAGLFRFAYQDHEATGLQKNSPQKIPEREFSPAELMLLFASNFWSHHCCC